jgi:hypothetical protein
MIKLIFEAANRLKWCITMMSPKTSLIRFYTGVKPMGYRSQTYGFFWQRGMGYGLWVMVCISPPTDLVDWLSYGLLQVMGYHRYGL